MKFFIKLLDKYFEITFLIFFLAILLGIIIFANATLFTQNISPELAWSFLHGQTHFLTEIDSPDLIFYQGNAYWHMPPLPAFILMPVVFIFNGPIPQGAINILLNILLFLIIYFFCHYKFNFSKINSIWLGILYLFSSVYVSAIFFIETYYYAQTIATILLFLALLEFYCKKRYWLIGIIFALILLTRFTATLPILFFVLFIIFSKNNYKEKIKKLILLFLPLFIAINILFIYNYLRVENPFVNTYTLTEAYQGSPLLHPNGLFSPKYIQSNFYFYFLEGFKPVIKAVDSNQPQYLLEFPYITVNKGGATSLFIISPLFILLYKANWRKKTIKYALITSGLIILTLLSYYYNGTPQIGSRYLNDTLPLLFLVLLYILQKSQITNKYKLIIIGSVILNIFLWYTWINSLIL